MGTLFPSITPDSRNTWDKHGERASLLDYLAVYSDFATAFNAAITAITSFPATTQRGTWVGYSLQIPAGTYLINSSISVNVNNLTIYGEGEANTILVRNANMPTGVGVFDITGTGVLFRDFTLDGAVTTAVGLMYSAFSYNPMSSLLTENTSFWAHGGSGNLKWERVTIQHTGGYAICLDAETTGNIQNVKIQACTFQNNRPHLFGLTSGAENYGSWTGGVHCQGDGNNYCCIDVLVSHCTFQRNTGIGVWQHAFALNMFHQNIRVKGNSFVDQGLDGIEMGAVLGGIVSDNTMRRIGYICTADTGASVPQWLNGAWATGIDTTGLVMGVNYVNNTLTSCNGGYLNLDGYSQGTVTGNKLRTPRTFDPEYTTDGVGAAGWAGRVGSGPSYEEGIQTSNTSNTQQGAEGITIVGNSICNVFGGQIGLFAGRDCHVLGNNLLVPADPSAPPIEVGPIGSGVYQRSYNNVVRDNRIDYSPASPAPAIYENATYAAFQPGDVNFYFDNLLSPSGSLAYEVETSANSNSDTAVSLSSNLPGLTACSSHFLRREGAGVAGSSALKFYYREGSLVAQHAQLQAYYKTGTVGPLFNVSAAGSGGIFATGARTTSVFTDAVITGKLYGDSLIALTDTTYVSGDEALLPSTVATMHYISASSALQTNLGITTRQLGTQLSALSSSTRGSVTLTGTSVAWVSGDHFNVNWAAGTQFIIGGVGYAIASVASTTALTLSTGPGSGTYAWNLQSPLFNVSAAGSPGTGILATANRTTAAFDDCIVTGKLYGDAFLALGSTTYADIEANLLGSTIALLRFKSSVGYIEQSITVSGSIRVWIPLGGSGGSVAGSDKDVQINDSGSFGADTGLFTWNYTNHTLFCGNAAEPISMSTSVRAAFYDDANSNPLIRFIGDTSVSTVSYTAETYTNVVGSGGVFIGYTGTGTAASPSATVGTQFLARFQGGGYTSSGLSAQASIAMVAGSNWTTSTMETYISFSVTPASSTSLTEAMRIFSNGVLAIHRTTSDGSGAYLQVNGSISGSGGFYSVGTSYNQCQMPSGGYLGVNANLTGYFAMAQKVTPTPSTGDSWSSAPGILHFNVSGGQYFWYFSYGTGTSSYADAFINSAGINATNTAYNAIQAPSGGLFAGLGLTTNQALYPKAYASSSSLNNPASGYGGIGYNTGSTYFYWNGTAWASFSFASVGATIYNVDTTVTSALTYTAGSGGIPAVVQGALFVGRFVQDGTGHAATFGSGFKATPPPDPTASMVSALIWFGGADGNWWCVGSALGIHP